MAARDTPTVALAGCGRWGLSILRDLQLLGATVIVVDPAPASRARALSAGADVVLPTLDATAVDGIIVATPATTHAQVIESLLEHRVPIFTEKPLTTEIGAARRLASAAPSQLFVMHNWRYHAGIELLAWIAQSGEIGPLHGVRTTRTNWTSPRTDTDAFWTLLPHDLSIALAILGAVPRPRYAHAEICDGRAVSVFAALTDPHWLIVEASNRYADKRREVRLHCRDGVAVLPHGEAAFIEIAADERATPEEPRLERRRFEYNPPLYRELEVFLGHLRGGPPPKTTAAEGLEIVESVAALRGLAGLVQTGR